MIVLLLLVLITSIYGIYKTINSRGSPLENITKKEEINYDTNFALMIEQDDGTYIESTSTKWPENYKLNIEKSKCIDKDGNILNDVLTENNNTIQVKTTTTSYCYLYFDILSDTEKLMETEDVWDSTLEDDGYRYVGENPDNYICFGTIDISTCISNTDLYMYRIIGIFEDNEGIQHIKLIKKEALNNSYTWNTDNKTDINWINSDLYKGLNGSYFLTNTTYSYMQNNNWLNKIVNWDYTLVNTISYANYSLNEVYGPNYFYQTVETTYLHELNRNSKNNKTCYYNASTIVDCNIGKWETLSTKIGLMYASDYQLSLGNKTLDYLNSDSTHYAIMKTGWMHISNNDSAPPSQYEWTISRYGEYTDGGHLAWYIDSPGYVGNYGVHRKYSVRPVFYLTSDIELTGEGTIDNPYIITN